MSKTLGLGVIGCGEITNKATAKGIAVAENVKLIQVMDIRPEIAKDMGAQYGVPWTADLDALLGNAAVEAVYIATPHYLHAPLAIKAMDAGKHVLGEKPVATALADADAMIAKAKEKGVKLHVAYSAQVDPVMNQIQAWIAAGMLGKITGLRIVYRGDKDPSYWEGGFTLRVMDPWRKFLAKAGGGPLIMNTVHDLNTMRYLTGLEAVRVYADFGTYTTPGVEVEDFIALNVRYNSGAIGTLEALCTLPGRDPLGAVNRIYGDKGQIVFGRSGPEIYLREAWGDIPADEWWAMPTPERDPAPRKTMIERFAATVMGDEALCATGWDGRQALEIIVAAYQSGQTHEAVPLPL